LQRVLTFISQYFEGFKSKDVTLDEAGDAAEKLGVDKLNIKDA